jgi:hypothetical protein
MSDEYDGTQPLPTPNDGPSMHDLVIKDMEDRKAFGLRKYGALLQANNGRDALQDLYDELLDAIVYVRQLQQEGITRVHVMQDGPHITNIRAIYDETFHRDDATVIVDGWSFRRLASGVMQVQQSV